jgi:hypothetical protein
MTVAICIGYYACGATCGYLTLRAFFRRMDRAYPRFAPHRFDAGGIVFAFVLLPLMWPVLCPAIWILDMFVDEPVGTRRRK